MRENLSLETEVPGIAWTQSSEKRYRVFAIKAGAIFHKSF